jgi:DNA-binding CsgD family transcriptional regulator
LPLPAVAGRLDEHTGEGTDVDEAATQRGMTALTTAVESADDATSLFADAADRLRRLVPFDGSAWFATDPATILGTSPVLIENVESGHCESFWEREFLVEDAILFRDVARSETGVGTLYTATDERPARSARYREYLAPQGYEDELRAAFRVGESTWGVVDLYRDKKRAAFTADEMELVRSVAPVIGTALRTFSLSTRVAGGRAGVDGPGTALFNTNGTVISLDETAEQLFAELAGPNWSRRPHPMTPIVGVVARAVAVHEGRDRGPAAARIRSLSGRWLAIHASCLRTPDGTPGPTALTIEPAKSAQIAPIIVEAYCLTPREQEITRAVARGLSNPEIAAELFVSPFTVRDHLKAIFAKVGVSSRGELVAKLFADHYAPELHEAALHVN